MPELIFGMLLGSIITCFIVSVFSKIDGTFHIDRSNPEKDIYRIEIDKLENLHKRKRILLKVNPKANLSQD